MCVLKSDVIAIYPIGCTSIIWKVVMHLSIDINVAIISVSIADTIHDVDSTSIVHISMSNFRNIVDTTGTIAVYLINPILLYFCRQSLL